MSNYCIVNVGMGNVGSVRNWLHRFGIYSINEDFGKIKKEDLIIIPGVADAGKLLTEIEKSGIRKIIESHINSGGKLLGICAGMQILYEYLEEGGRPGIGYFKGPVVKINPHNGWEEVAVSNFGEIKRLNNSRLKKISGRMYFNHEYAACEINEDVVNNVMVAGTGIANIVCRDSVIGVQAHPEKSQKMGMNFLKLLVRK